MKNNKQLVFSPFLGIIAVTSIFALLISCNTRSSSNPIQQINLSSDHHIDDLVIVNRNVYMKDYLDYMDSLSLALADSLGYDLNEYTLVHRNSWIIDSLRATDYYLLKDRNIFIEDPLSIKLLSRNDTLWIPGPGFVDSLKALFGMVTIDVNIPEFLLRIKIGEVILHTFPVRVGQNRRKYLAMAGKAIDLRTKKGIGKIVRISRDPTYINPSNNRVYYSTKRDDGKITKLPRIPWLEPEINGQRHGQLIHPTTNPVTLGKAYSNGCIGVKESDMWMIYYYAPLNTSVTIRYDREVTDDEGNVIFLPEVYPGYGNNKIVGSYDEGSCCICNL
ncbi:MAG: L,D-transpeptidase [Saprospiraceae bacterium]|nr:L,D-transpeptidase [Saprospiraceae bacterium]